MIFWTLFSPSWCLLGIVKVKGSLGCNGHEMMEFKIVRTVRRVHSKLTALDFRRADKQSLFKDLFGRVMWDKALDERGAQESWLHSQIISFKLKSNASQQDSQAKCQEACMDAQDAPNANR